MATNRSLALLGLWLGGALAHVTTVYGRSTAVSPLPPSQDPWYTAPDDYENTIPGTVLRLRTVPGNLTQATGNTSAAYNILYRTTDSQYKPTWAVTTLFVPHLGKDSTAALVFNQSALLSYQVPYDSADVDASPSYTLYNADPTMPIGQAVGLGLFVSVPDYEGPLASFTAGVISGHATIDSVRAILSLGLGLDTSSARVALWGYSGGALASEWATELLVQYAPELSDTVVGAAIGGLTPNITSVLASVSDTSSAGLAPSSILGITSQYPAVQRYLISLLKTEGPYNKTGFLAAKNYTLAEAGVAYAGHDIGDYFTSGLAIFHDPKVLAVVNQDGIMGYHGVPRVPVFAYKAIHDEISKISDTDELVKRYCAVGANILYQRNTVGGHSEEATNSLAMAVEWLASVLTGTYAHVFETEGCTIQNVTRKAKTSSLRRRDRAKDVFGLW